MSDTFVFLAAVAATYLFAGFVKGSVGMGLPTIAMGILSLVLAPSEAAALLVLPTLATNTWQVLAGPALWRLLGRFATMIAATLAGTLATIGLLTSASPLATAAIGAVLALYGAIGLAWRPAEVARRHERWLSPLVGLVTGMLGGATGISFIPSIPYLGSLELEKEELVQAMGLSAFFAAASLGLGLALHGRFHGGLAGGSFLALFPALAGMYAGQRVRRKLPVAAFRRWFLILLAVLGAYLFARSLWRALTL